MAEYDCDMLIIGAGPTGLYAAYYAGFRGFSVIIMDALPEAGGQITAMYPEKEIFDVAGFATVKGRDLVEGLLAQANQFNPTYLLGEQAVTLETSEDELARVTGDAGSVITAKSVVIAGGIGSFKPRPIPVGAEWVDKGVVYFVPRLDDHSGKDIVIVGGGDSALDWAWSLKPIAKSVSVIHRRDEFRAHASMVDKVRDAGVRLITSSQISELRGDDVVTEIDVKSNTDGSIETLQVQTVVAALGFIANIGPMAKWGLELEKRRIVVDTTMKTNLPRVYAAGDINVYPGKVAIIAVGFGEAALAVNNAAPLISPEYGVFPGHSSGESGE
ncbi:MAG: NAD(P)/FAD-dependent oxidoreductase [Actinomycetes bacterium]